MLVGAVVGLGGEREAPSGGSVGRGSGAALGAGWVMVGDTQI